MNEIAETPEQPREVAERLNRQVTPMDMLNMAVSNNADLDKLDKLMTLQERWEANEAKKAFASALAGFQADLPKIKKSNTVDYSNKTGGRTTFDFANIDNIAEAIRPILQKYQLSFRHEQQQDGQLITVTCIVTHALGHSEKTTISASADTSGGKNAIQAIASAVTYLRRYTLTGALGITTGEDDNDGGKPSITVDELLDYINVVRDEIHSVAAVKSALSDDNYSTAKEAWQELDEPTQRALWRAPSKGGIFTTEERTRMKSSEWAKAE